MKCKTPSFPLCMHFYRRSPPEIRIMSAKFSTLFCAFYLLLCISVQLINATEKVPTEAGTIPGQCVASNELESLRYRLYSELSDTKKEIDTLRNDLHYWKNETLNILKKYLIHTENSEWDQSRSCDLTTINEKLASLQLQPSRSTCNTTEEIIDQVRAVMETYKRAQSQELREIISEMSSGRLPLGTFLNPAPSCKLVPEGSSSGNYWIQNVGTGYASLEYCDMSRRCCNSTGGWMRVANLDMTDPTHHCPTGFRKITTPKRTCGRPGGGCSSTTYAVDGISYSRVCGKVKAYQSYSPEAFSPYYNNRARTIDDVYVDGVSLTHSQNPRKHIWTFANAVYEIYSNQNVCPCTKTDTRYTGVVPPFIGNDYFCDTGSRYAVTNQFYSEDPLWDGAGCGGTSTCCQFNNPPWFCKQLSQPTTDNIELRICSDQGWGNEDIAIEQIEIFVQ